MEDIAAIGVAAGFADGKGLVVFSASTVAFYEVSLANLGSGVLMADGKFANPTTFSIAIPFTELTDVFNSYTGLGGRVVTVSVAEDGLTTIELTASSVGLGDVNNTSDADKPVSTAQQSALDNKQETLVSSTNIKTVNGNDLLGSGNVVIPTGDGTRNLYTGDNQEILNSERSIVYKPIDVSAGTKTLFSQTTPTNGMEVQVFSTAQCDETNLVIFEVNASPTIPHTIAGDTNLTFNGPNQFATLRYNATNADFEVISGAS